MAVQKFWMPIVALLLAALLFSLLWHGGRDISVKAQTISGVQSVAGTSALSGVACPTSAVCYAVGGACPSNPSCSDVGQYIGVLVSITNGTVGSVQDVPGTSYLEGVGCSSSTTCYAVGYDCVSSTTCYGGGPNIGVLVSITNGTAGSAQEVSGTSYLAGAVCSSSTVCYAVGNDSSTVNGAVVPITGGAVGSIQTVPGPANLQGVACPSSTICYAVGRDSIYNHFGLIVPVTGGTAGSPEYVSGTSSLGGVACPGSTICYAVGKDDSLPSEGAVVPVIGGAAGTVQTVPGAYGFDGIACATSTACYAVGQETSEFGAAVVPITGGTPGAVQLVPGMADSSSSGVACPSSITCYATVFTVGFWGDGAIVSITVPPAAAELAFATQPATTATAAALLVQQPEVAVQDASGNTITTDNSAVVTLSKGPSSTGAGNLTCTGGFSKTAVNGVASFSGCAFDQLGTYTIHATAGTLTPADSNFIAVTAAIAGNVWVDANQNKIKDSGETNYPNATIALSGAITNSTTTDASGNYSFTGLTTGSYAVTLTVPSGYKATTTNPVSVTVSPTSSTVTVNFGIVQMAALTLTASASPNPPVTGQSLTYTLTVKNNGPANATGMTLTDTLAITGSTAIGSSTLASLVSITPSCILAGSGAGPPAPGTKLAATNLFICSLGSLVPAASATVTIAIQPFVSSPATISDKAGVAADQPDPTPGDDTAALTLRVPAGGPAPSPLTITTASLPPGTVAQPYRTAALTATGGTPPYTWALASGSSLPAGLSLAPASGVISGTPTAANTSSFTVTLLDSSSPTQTASATLSMTVTAGAGASQPVLQLPFCTRLQTSCNLPANHPENWVIIQGHNTPDHTGQYEYAVDLQRCGSSDLSTCNANNISAQNTATEGEEVLAAAEGDVIFAQDTTGCIGIRHGSFIRAGQTRYYFTIYCHLQTPFLPSLTGPLALGQTVQVQQGQLIGYAGNTNTPAPQPPSCYPQGSGCPYHIHFALISAVDESANIDRVREPIQDLPAVVLYIPSERLGAFPVDSWESAQPDAYQNWVIARP